MPTIQSVVYNHIGNVRANNQDNFFLDGTYLTAEQCDAGAKLRADRDAVFQVYAVSDGMGGEAAGELAALEAVSALSPLKDALRHGANEAINHAVRQGNAAILRRARRIGRRMGATIAVIGLMGNKASVAFVGDSRAYRLRDGNFQQLSNDHTDAQHRIQLGLLTPEEALHHPSAHVLTRHLGMDAEDWPFECDFTPPLQLRADDVFLLCSDGLTGMLSDDVIARTLIAHSDIETAGSALLEQALQAGGYDNITVLVLRVLALDAAADEPVEATVDLDSDLRPSGGRRSHATKRRSNWIARLFGARK